jgi:O-antigen ligase
MKKKNPKKGRKESKAEGIIITAFICLVIPFLYFRNALDPVLYPRFAGWAGTVMLFALLISFFYRNKKQLEIPIKNPFLLILIGYLIWSFTALIWAGNPVEGMTDVFKWIIFPLFILLLYVLLTGNSKTFEILIKGIVIYALFTAVHGIMQFFEIVPRQSDANAVYDVKGLLAHKNQLSIALFLFIPFLFYAWNKLSKGWKRAALVAFGAVFLLILLLGTRAVWLALIFCGLCFVLIYGWLNRKTEKIKTYRWFKRILWIVGILLVGLVLSFWLLPEEFILNRFTARLSTIMDPEFTSNKWRSEMWHATINLFREHPFFGVGTGNWKIEIYPYYSDFQPSVFRHWRNPHNDFLLVATEKGVIGFVLFSFIYLIPAMIAYQNAKHAHTKAEKMIMILFSVFLLGYMFVSLFTFPGERIHHHVFLGVLMTSILVQQSGRTRKFLVSFPRKIFLWIPLLLMLPVVFFGIRTIIAEINLKKAFAQQDKKQWRPMIQYVERSNFRWAPLEPRSSCPIGFYEGYAKYKLKAYSDAKNIFMRSYRSHPNNQMITNNLGSVYGEIQMFDSAIYFFNRSIDLLPRYETGLINLSKAYYFEKDIEKSYQAILACDRQSNNQEVRQIRETLKRELNRKEN